MTKLFIKEIKSRQDMINIKQDQMRRLSQEIALLEENLKKECHHPKQYVEVKETYFGGTHFDHAYTDRIKVCTLCGTSGETETEMHSWYG